MGLDFLKNYGAQRTIGNGDAVNPFDNMSTDLLKEMRDEFAEMLKTGKRIFNGKVLSGAEIQIVNQQLTQINKSLLSRR